MERIGENRRAIIESLESQFQQGRKQRTPDDIKAEILQLALNGTLKTEIMYGCKLSYKMLCNYLKLLTENGLLEKRKIKLKENKEQEVFITTEKGRKWLTLYQQLRELEK